MLERKKIFCADDWGMSPGINAGILELAKKDFLYSVSLMSNTEFILDGLDELLSYQKKGLKFNIHFNLTFGKYKGEFSKNSTLVKSDGGFYDFYQLLIKAYTFQISAEECSAIFYHQCNSLRDLQVPISGVDGHHHVHLLPVINKAVAKSQLEQGIKDFRLMNDKNHMPSYTQSLIAAAQLKSSSVNFTHCGYLLEEDLKSKKHYLEKLKKFERLIAHPAVVNDFEKYGVEDILKEKRVDEFKKIMEYTI